MAYAAGVDGGEVGFFATPRFIGAARKWPPWTAERIPGGYVVKDASMRAFRLIALTGYTHCSRRFSQNMKLRLS